MTFGRWLLIHSLSISILLMLSVGYFFKNELRLNEAYRQLLQIDADVISLPSSDTASISAKEPNKALEVQQHKHEPMVVSTDNKNILMSNPPLKDVQKEDVVEFKTIPKAEVQKQTAVPKNVTLTNTKEQGISEDYLLLARQAYWNKDYKLSIENYSKEINKMPNSPDLYGELGNLYYGLKEYNLASINYLEAGKIMIELDDQNRAKQIYDILISIAPEKAKILLSLKNDKYQ